MKDKSFTQRFAPGAKSPDFEKGMVIKMKYLKQFFKQQKVKLVITITLLIGQVVGTLLIPFLIAGIVDNGILKGDMNAILRIGIQMLTIALITTIVSVAGAYYSADLAAAFGRDMREALFRKSQELSIREFDSIGVSSMITRTTSDISSLSQTLVMILQLIIPTPLIIIAGIIMTAIISPPLALIPIICILIFALLSWIILKKSSPLSQGIQTRMDKINQVVRESITGIRVIRAFDNGIYEQKRSDKTYEEYASNMIQINLLFAILTPTVWLIMGLSMAAIVFFGGALSVSGSMEIGEITAAIEYTIMTLSYLMIAVFSSITLPKMYSCLLRLEEVLNIETEITEANVSVIAPIKDAPVIEFDNVTFSYHEAEETIIEDLSFSCKMGQTTAIIGSTGSGKSTIAKLLLRLYDVNSGKILLNGVDIRSLSQEELREQIGYIPQKAFLFSGTIADNLLMGRNPATEEEMMDALRIAQAEAFVKALPNGLQSPVSQSGSNFSGGQKQRLAIARAIVKRPPILIFDDSFSALDYKTDATLRKVLKTEMTSTVKIIIAQRVSSIVDADQIIVLDEGRIVGLGKHDILMKNCLSYQEIAKSQLSLEEVPAV